MRFMIMVKATAETEAELETGLGKAPDEALFAAMADYHEQLVKAGMLIDGSGLHPSARGKRIAYKGGKRLVTDGPFTETKEIIAGYTIIRAASWEEAMEWAMRFPNPMGEGNEAEIEIRQLMDLDDFEPSQSVERFRQMDLASKP